jgi:hypothetical protein
MTKLVPSWVPATALLMPSWVPATALLMVALATPSSALAQSGPGGGGGGDCFLGICDPGAWLRDVVAQIVASFLGGLISGIGGAISSFPNDVDFLLRTPERLSYQNNTVQQFAAASRVLANALLALVALVGGFNIMFRPYLGSSYASALEFLPRFLLGAILVNTAGWWVQLAIDVNNALCGVFGAGPPPNLADSLGRSMLPTELLIGLIYVVMGLLLVLQQLMRLALVDVLVILAPLAALLWILPQTHGWGRLWGTLFVGTVFAQTVQVLALRLGFNLTTDIPPATGSGLIQPLLGIAVLALALKIPGLMRRGSGGGNLVGSLIGTAAGAVIGGGASRMALGALGAGRAGSAPGVARAARPPGGGGGAQYSLPMTVAVPSGGGSSQLSLPMSVPHQASGRA